MADIDDPIYPELATPASTDRILGYRPAGSDPMNYMEAGKLPVSTAQAAADAAVLAAAVQLTGAQTVAGIKTFSSSPVVPGLQFSTTSIAASALAAMRWNDTDKCHEFETDGGVMIQIGQEAVIYSRNASGVNEPNGAAVILTGASGQRATVALARADALATCRSTIGLVTTAAGIANNGFGFVTTQGLVRDLDTSAFTEGAELWLSTTTAGGYSITKPSAEGQFVVRIGFVVRSHATQGSILVAPHYHGSVTGDGVMNAVSKSAARTAIDAAAADLSGAASRAALSAYGEKRARTAILNTYLPHPNPPTIDESVAAGSTATTTIASGTSFAMDSNETYYRVYGCSGLVSEANFFGATAWRSETPVSDTPTLWTPWAVEFISSALEVEMCWAKIADGDEFRLLVDGYVVRNTDRTASAQTQRGFAPFSFGYATASGNFRLKTTWTYEEPRLYRMEFWSNSRFVTVRVPTGKTVVKPQNDLRKKVLFFGDSWTEVGGGNFEWNNWAAQVSRALGVDGIRSGAGGCGYKNTAGGGRLNGLDRLATDTVGLPEPDYIVVAYGLNDVTFQWDDAGEIAATKANIDAFFPALRLIYPNAPIIVFGVFQPATPTSKDTEFNAYLSGACETAGATFIETLDSGIFLGDSVAIAPYLADAGHITAFGHTELAAWALPKLGAIITARGQP